MNERTTLPRRPCEARGQVTLRYTDPVTGRVLEEVKGKNHVFTMQLGGTTGFQSTAMKADLLLCQGGSYPDADWKLPFIPGEPIGFGRPGKEGTGLYQGTYRAAESWLDRVTKNGVSAKYVYDFLPTQALGKVSWVGLTAALGNGISTPAYAPPAMGFSNMSRVYDCEKQRYFRAAVFSGDSGYHVGLYMKNCFEEAEEGMVDVSALAGIPELRTSSSYPRTVRTFFDTAEEAVYVMFRGTPVGTTAAIYKVVKLTASGEFLGVWDITSGTELLYACTYPGGARDGKLYSMAPAGDYRGYTRYVCDVEAGTITAVEVALEESSPSLLRWEGSAAFLWGDQFWYPRRDYYDPADDDAGDYFLYGSPMFDLSTGAVHGLVPPSPYEKSPANFHVGVSPIAAFGGQWVKTAMDDSALALPFAYTCYAVPEGTSERPEGSAMTVSYELDVTW